MVPTFCSQIRLHLPHCHKLSTPRWNACKLYLIWLELEGLKSLQVVLDMIGVGWFALFVSCTWSDWSYLVKNFVHVREVLACSLLCLWDQRMLARSYSFMCNPHTCWLLVVHVRALVAWWKLTRRVVAMHGVQICEFMLERKSAGLIIVRKIESWIGMFLATASIEN
jgi:hypothetical protein